jgi:HAD superfamily hydrolase (TIGR01509 family)
VLSAAIGSRKPEARAFQTVLDRFGADPADALLVDDSAANVAGARALGMATHRYDGDDEALRVAVAAFERRGR